jgi:pyruvate dehydrogenase E1 component alpha subunit
LDGNDVLGVYENAVEAVEWCRSGKGPVFMEFLTYRFRGHVGPDDNVQGSHTDIRPKAEVDAWLKRDPLALMEQKLMADGLMTSAEKDHILQAVNKEVEEAHAFMSASEKPKPEELCHYVFK